MRNDTLDARLRGHDDEPMRALLLVPFLLLAACGQSGDLYLPPGQPEPAATPAEAPPAEAPAEKEKDKK
jgi:predicted small lipoprotein YifL